MRVLGRDQIKAFQKKHPKARKPLNAWFAEAENATWTQWADIKTDYPRADWLGKNRVVFDIKGNDFRLVVLVSFKLGQVVVERVGTHAEYSKWQLKR